MSDIDATGANRGNMNETGDEARGVTGNAKDTARALRDEAAGDHAGPGDPGGHGVCLNCGTVLVGPRCHQCGQEAHLHRTVSGIWHEILHGVVHFDGKLWRTLPLLITRPGELTRRYIAGERARFVSPMALFLFALFVMFAVFQIAGISPSADLSGAPQVAVGVEQADQRLTTERRHAVAERNRLSHDDPRRVEIDARVAELDETLGALHRAAPAIESEEGNHIDIHTGWHRLDKGIKKAADNPSLALYKLQSNSYKFSWLLIPLSLPFVWLMFAWRREYNFYDHGVFVTYSLAFMSLFFLVLTILGTIGIPSRFLTIAAVLVPPVHLYRHLKGAYLLGRWTALLRTVVMLVVIAIVLLLFLAALLFLGLVG